MRKVCVAGRISFAGRTCRISKAFAGEPVAVRPTTTDGVMAVYYCHQRITEIDLSRGSEVG